MSLNDFQVATQGVDVYPGVYAPSGFGSQIFIIVGVANPTKSSNNSDPLYANQVHSYTQQLQFFKPV
jgi:hypothetical protein